MFRPKSAATALNRRSLLAGALPFLLSPRVATAAAAAPYEVQGGQFKGFDGADLFYRRTGTGPPILLLHGLLGDGPRTWFSTGVAQALAAAGFEAIAPDARAHGLSAAPVDPADYPKDVQAMDVEALMRFLGLRSVRVVGYGLGAQTAVRMMVRGDPVERAVLAGAGDRSITQTERLAASYETLVLRPREGRDPTLGVEAHAAIRLQRLNPAALVDLLRSERSTPASALARIRTPILVVTGRLENDAGTAEALADLFPDARALHTDGSHLAALRDPRFSELTRDFLASRAPASQVELPLR